MMRIFPITLILGFLMLCNVKADDSLCKRPNLPANMWEKLPGGINVALGFSSCSNSESLVVYIENRSGKDFLVDQYLYDSGVQIFYEDGKNFVPLHTWETERSVRDEQDSLPTWTGPGQTFEVEITNLGPKELALLKNHAVKCILPVYPALAKGKITTIETTPQLLKQIPSK